LVKKFNNNCEQKKIT